ncbi:MAG: TetR/AcrR family transcriptional regulator [Bacteroidetes bacterium]|nr:TetR/AcrR family transcriptional regulator [Bacteroidota bacterium]MBS1686731.1 TetR/AcrR family transcriptional regulator [Bacteroidota bacterium]
MALVKPTDKNTEKRKAIMDACLDLFCEKCYQDTSTASISQKAGVATGTLFLYFENKEELVNELYLDCKSEMADYMEDGVWEHTTFKARLRHVWDRSLEWKMTNDQKLKFMMQFSSSPTITRMTKEKAMNRHTIVTEIVQKAIESGEAVTSSAELLSAMISGYMHTAALYLLNERHSKNFRKWSDESFNFFWKGIN